MLCASIVLCASSQPLHGVSMASLYDGIFCGTHESAPTSSAMSKFSRRFCATLIVYLHIQSYTHAIAIYIQVCFCRSCAVVAPAAQHAHLCCRTALAVLSPVVVFEQTDMGIGATTRCCKKKAKAKQDYIYIYTYTYARPLTSGTRLSSR